ncbi:hypothetical protein TNCV_3798621 [Trichonephila clavipes]|nr:hypothetical protein TNCV_3798621 [Trichonephila clavipes]
MAQKRKVDNYDDYDCDTESLSSFESVEDFAHMPSWHEGTLNSSRAASPLMRLVKGEEKWETYRVLSLKIGVEPSKIVLSPLPVRLITTTNERRLVQGHETTPLRVKRDVKDAPSELDNGG